MNTDAQQALDALAALHGLSDDYPDAVLAEVAALVADPGIDDPGLDDLTELPFVTIDEPESRDLDQALCLQRERTGYVVWYAIADAAHFVPPHSALFAEALTRGASYYLPDRVYPMLPRELSEGLVSLNAGVDRRALVFEMRLDAEGHCLTTRLRPARIHSRAKLSYSGVQAWFDGHASLAVRDQHALESLKLLPVIGGLRLRDAAERDVVHYRRTEVDVSLGDTVPAQFVATSTPRNEVQRFNEQLSLLCNTEGARWLEKGDSPHDAVEPVFRVHDPPGLERLQALERQLEGIAAAHHLDPASWIWRADGSLPLADFLARLPHEGREGRIARAIHRQAVRANQRSVFTPQAGPHHGVGAPVYGRFSAPMREAVGVYLHQEVVQRRTGTQGRLPHGITAPEQLREQIVQSANRARERQRQLDRGANRLVLDALFASAARSGQEWTGTVMGLTLGKVHAQLDDPAVDVKAYVRHQQSRLDLDDRSCRLSVDDADWLRVGDPVRVRVAGRDEPADRWDLRVRPVPPT